MSPAGTDCAVIMARGGSLRMGRPKGLCRLPGRRRNFLQLILDLYAGFGLPAAVVAAPQTLDGYRRAAGPRRQVEWIPEDPGGGTARTVLAAVAALGARHARLWLHPVDLPLVAASTLGALARTARDHPGAIVAPVRDGRPGHPVLIPTADFREAAPRRAGIEADMRDLLRGGGSRLVEVAVTDPGVTLDFDYPADLEAYDRNDPED